MEKGKKRAIAPGIPRCFKPEGFGPVKSAKLHNFSDASNVKYGQCSYLRLQNDEGKVHCSLVMGKVRLSPLKTVSYAPTGANSGVGFC